MIRVRRLVVDYLAPALLNQITESPGGGGSIPSVPMSEANGSECRNLFSISVSISPPLSNNKIRGFIKNKAR